MSFSIFRDGELAIDIRVVDAPASGVLLFFQGPWWGRGIMLLCDGRGAAALLP